MKVSDRSLLHRSSPVPVSELSAGDCFFLGGLWRQVVHTVASECANFIDVVYEQVGPDPTFGMASMLSNVYLETVKMPRRWHRFDYYG